MRRFVVWTTSKSEYGTGIWAIIDGTVFVRAWSKGHADRRIKPLGPCFVAPHLSLQSISPATA